jgi:hypothetical protein
MKELQLFVEQYDILIPEIEDGYDNEIRFKNGSYIKVIKPEEKSETVRGKRASFGHWMFDFEGCMLSKEQIDEVLKPFCKEREKVVYHNKQYGDVNAEIATTNEDGTVNLLCHGVTTYDLCHVSRKDIERIE